MESLIKAVKKEPEPGHYRYDIMVDDQYIQLTPMQVVKLNNVLHEIGGNSNTEVIYRFTDTTV